MHSLQAERGISALIWLGLALGLFSLWSAWFFWAPITRYETGALVDTTRDGRLVAEFPARAYDAIWQGQVAYIRPHPMHGTEQIVPVSFSAVVANILQPPSDDHFQITLSLEPADNVEMLFAPNLTGEVVVEVEQVSPARLVARASGQFLDTPSLSFSPQQIN